MSFYPTVIIRTRQMIMEAQYLSTLNVISISYSVLIVDLVNFKLWSSCRQYAGSITPVSAKVVAFLPYEQRFLSCMFVERLRSRSRRLLVVYSRVVCFTRPSVAFCS